MEQSTNEILSRIEWCRLQRKGAVTRDEEEGWQAEEAGLIDALLGRDRTEMRKTSHPSLLERYRLGLQDGRVLMRFAPALQSGGVESEIVEGRGQVPSR